MPAGVTRRWTAREVRDLIAAQPLYTPRYELVDGELLVTPSPAFIHQRAVTRLVVLLSAYVDPNGLGLVLTSPSDVELEPEDVRQPDVFVIPPDELNRATGEGNPVRALILAIEVLSPSSSRHDRVRKRPGYQRHVGEYCIFDLDARVVERWRSGDERPDILERSVSWKPGGATEAFALDLERFFTEVHGEER